MEGCADPSIHRKRAQNSIPQPKTLIFPKRPRPSLSGKSSPRITDVIVISDSDDEIDTIVDSMPRRTSTTQKSVVTLDCKDKEPLENKPKVPLMAELGIEKLNKYLYAITTEPELLSVPVESCMSVITKELSATPVSTDIVVMNNETQDTHQSSVRIADVDKVSTNTVETKIEDDHPGVLTEEDLRLSEETTPDIVKDADVPMPSPSMGTLTDKTDNNEEVVDGIDNEPPTTKMQEYAEIAKGYQDVSEQLMQENAALSRINTDLKLKLKVASSMLNKEESVQKDGAEKGKDYLKMAQIDARKAKSELRQAVLMTQHAQQALTGKEAIVGRQKAKILSLLDRIELQKQEITVLNRKLHGVKRFGGGIHLRTVLYQNELMFQAKQRALADEYQSKIKIMEKRLIELGIAVNEKPEQDEKYMEPNGFQQNRVNSCRDDDRKRKEKCI